MDKMHTYVVSFCNLIGTARARRRESPADVTEVFRLVVRKILKCADACAQTTSVFLHIVAIRTPSKLENSLNLLDYCLTDAVLYGTICYCAHKYVKLYFEEDLVCADFTRYLRISNSSVRDLDIESMIQIICCN